MKKEYSSKKIIKGFKENNETIINYVYNNCFRYVSWYILNNNGSNEDAKDVMQEGMLMFFRKCKKTDFVLETHPFTYVNNICKFIWLNKKKNEKKHKSHFTLDEIDNEGIYTIEIDDDNNTKEFEKTYEKKKRIYRSCFNLLMEECKTILTLTLTGESISNITKAMNYKDDSFTTDKKRRCKEKLLKLICEHPKYKKLNNE